MHSSMPSSPIHHTFAPLADQRQRWLACAALLSPLRYLHGKSTERLETMLGEKFTADAFAFASGRDALYAILRALKMQAGDEVIVQCYTCVVVPNAIRAAEATPVFVDIERDTLNFDFKALEQAITPRTKAIICQHTFGIPAATKRLRALCDARSIILIEDCAHVLPDETGPASIGALGDFLMLSFGRDKAISGVAGGAAVSRRINQSAEIDLLRFRAKKVKLWTVIRFLLYPLLYGVARPLYGFGVGKGVLWLAGKVSLLPPIVTAEEKHGHQKPIVHAMPNACAFLALDQLKRLKELNDARREVTAFYLLEGKARGWPVLNGVTADLPLQKFPLFVLQAENIRRALKRQNILLEDGWTECVICPDSVDIPDTGYALGEDPTAEAVCQEILSLPTHPTMTMEQAHRVVRALDALMSRI